MNKLELIILFVKLVFEKLNRDEQMELKLKTVEGRCNKAIVFQNSYVRYVESTGHFNFNRFALFFYSLKRIKFN